MQALKRMLNGWFSADQLVSCDSPIRHVVYNLSTRWGVSCPGPSNLNRHTTALIPLFWLLALSVAVSAETLVAGGRSATGLAVENGWYVCDHKVVWGLCQHNGWWRPGQRPNLTRNALGEIGPNRTEDFDKLTDAMLRFAYPGFEHNFGLWYDRRRDAHDQTRRYDTRVVPPFLEQSLGVGLWRLMATVDHPQHLRGESTLSLRGAKGLAIDVNAVEKFSSGHPLKNIEICLSGMSHSALGGSFSLGASLDGKTIIKLGTQTGKRRADGLYRGTHTLDLREVPEFQSVRKFHVHMNQRNNSGLRTNTSSSLDTLEINATRVN